MEEYSVAEHARLLTTDIRLSAALCCLGFALKLESQPVTVTVREGGSRQVSFAHEPEIACHRFDAGHVEMWWIARPGKYSIPGYDDALTAIRRVFVERERMIGIAKDPRTPQRALGADFGTDSLHAAAILATCDVEFLGYEKPTRRWLFSRHTSHVTRHTSIDIAQLIVENRNNCTRPSAEGETDLCIDFMLEALRYRDWLARIVKDPECIPIIEMVDGERILRVSSAMPERDQRQWISRL